MEEETKRQVESLLTYIAKADRSRACTFIKIEAARILKDLNNTKKLKNDD